MSFLSPDASRTPRRLPLHALLSGSLLVLLLVSPAVTASFTLDAQNPQDAAPVGASVGVPILASVDCQTILAGGGVLASWSLAFDLPPAPKGVAVTGNASVVLDVSPCTSAPTSTLQHTEIFHLLASEQAEGIVTQSVPLSARLVESRPGSSPLAAQTNLTFHVAYRAGVAVQVPVTIEQTEPGHPAPFKLHFQNTGNAATVYTATVAGRPELSVTDVRLEPGAATDATLAIPGLGGSGWVNKEQSYAITFTAAPVVGGDAQSVGQDSHVLVRTRGFAVAGHAVPVGIVTLAVALVLVALAYLVFLPLRKRNT